MDYLQFKEQLNKQRSLQHHGIKGQRWGIRRFQNEDGTLTKEGQKRYDKIQKDISEYSKKVDKLKENVPQLEKDIEKLKNEDLKSYRNRYGFNDPDYTDEYVQESKDEDLSILENELKWCKEDIDKYSKILSTLKTQSLDTNTVSEWKKAEDIKFHGYAISGTALGALAGAGISYVTNLNSPISSESIASGIIAIAGGALLGAVGGIFKGGLSSSYEKAEENYLKEHGK